ncbi:MAG TPA: class I SAM-dependent methyltransferase, partial [Capillimicrobium sp.]
MPDRGGDARAVPCDYDVDPERFVTARRVLSEHATDEDVHGPVARRLLAEDATPVLDVGCGDGALSRYLPAGAWVGVDTSARMLDRAPAGALLGDAAALPFDDGAFASVTLLYVLYHLADPRQALAEAHRVLRPGGLIFAAAPSRWDSPELPVLGERPPLTFDAEIAPSMLGERFEAVEVESWDAPLLKLPDRES